MAIKERLAGVRFHIIFAAVSAAALFSLLRLGPSFAAVVGFFWPLLLSTGCFLAAVAVLLRISPPPVESPGDKTGEELMDYVAGRPPEVAGGEEEEAAEEHRTSQ